MKENCWEAKKCGRQSGGAKVLQMGACPAATETSHDGINSGKNGGRYCWRVTGTLCDAKVQGNWVKKMAECAKCEFLKRLQKEEGPNLKY